MVNYQPNHINFKQTNQPVSFQYATPNVPNQPGRLQRVLMVAGIIGGVLILGIIGLSVIGGDKTPPQLATIMSRQAELLSLIDEYSGDLRDSTISSLTSTTRAILLSDQQTLTASASEAGATVAEPVFDTTLQEELESAKNTSNLDETMRRVLLGQLKDNLVELEQLFDATNQAALKVAAKTAYDNQKIILE